jgi:hypothetical protein
MWWWKVRGSAPGRVMRFSLFKKSHQALEPTIIFSVWGGGGKAAVVQSWPLTLSRVEVKNKWSCTSAVLCAFVKRTGTILYFIFVIYAVSISYVWATGKNLSYIVAGPSPCGPRFDPRPVRVGFVVYQYIMALAQVFLRLLLFIPCQYHVTNAPYSWFYILPTL